MVRTLRLLLVLILLTVAPCRAQEDEQSFEIDYVLEPFEHLVFLTYNSQEANGSAMEIGSGLFGWGAAEFIVTEDNGTIPIRIEQVETDSRHQRHNCIGATRFSLWCKTNSTEEDLLVSLSFQVSDCRDSFEGDCGAEEFVLMNERNLTESLVERGGEWQELSWEINDRQGTGLTQNLDQLKGWAISVRSSKDTSATMEGVWSSVAAVDQLSCKGGGDLLGAPFRTTDSFETALAHSAWGKDGTDEQMLNDTNIQFIDDRLVLDPYYVATTEAWGGFVGLDHEAPFASYYNISGAISLTLGYNVLTPVFPDLVHLRINLFDASDCRHFSCQEGDDQEHFYSFHHSVLPFSGPGIVNIALEGDDSYNLPFLFTGWSGGVSNKQLDLKSIKGFRLEMNIVDDGVLGTVATGAVALGPLSVTNKITLAAEKSGECKEGDSIALKRVPAHFQSAHYESDCCNRCAEDDNCQYAITGGTACYLASHIESSVVGLRGDIHGDLRIFSFLSEGDYCDFCLCDEGAELIDCRGRDLRALPTTFGNAAKWLPRALDLRDNPRLAFIGGSMLEPIASSLEELRRLGDMRRLLSS